MNSFFLILLVVTSVLVGFYIREHQERVVDGWAAVQRYAFAATARLGLLVSSPPPSSTGAALSVSSKGGKVFTVDELARYRGTAEQPKIYLALLGEVYDVTTGPQHYGPGGGYEHFAGVDGSAAFITGEFVDGVTSDIDALTDEQTLALFDWKRFYDEHESYRRVGVLNDRFYGPDGQPTDHLARALEKREAGVKFRATEQRFKERWPPCNFRSSADDPRIEMWCADQSGGIKRGWAGYPRELFDGSRRGMVRRCACVRAQDFDSPLVRQYEGCSKKSRTCYRTREAAIAAEQGKTEL